MPKDLEAKKKRELYEAKHREAADRKNERQKKALYDFKAEVKAIRKEIYG